MFKKIITDMNAKSFLIRIVVYTIVIFIALEFIVPIVSGILYFLPYGISAGLTAAIFVFIVENILSKYS